MAVRRFDMSGQAVAEYVLILAAVAVLLITAFTALQGGIADALKPLTEPAAIAASLTPLGSTFTDISNNMINLIMNFYRKNNNWPHSWGDLAYTDLGLKPEDWQNGVNGIIYKPVGSRMAITPASGYTFVVNDINGNQLTMPSSYNWSLVYNMQTGTWHHKSITGPQLNIASLQVIPPKLK